MSSNAVGLLILILTSGARAPELPASGVQATSGDEHKVQALLTIVRDAKLRDKDPDRVAEAIVRLGELRAEPAIDDLVQLLTFPRVLPWEREKNPQVVNEIHLITPGYRYPAISALAQIGRASLPALVDALEKHEVGSGTSRNALEVVRYFFRDKPSDGAQYLRKAAASAANPEFAERLRKAAAAL